MLYSGSAHNDNAEAAQSESESALRTAHSALFVFIVHLRICSSIVTYIQGPGSDPACMRTSQLLIPASSALNFGFWVSRSRFLVMDDEKIVDHVCD